VSRRLRTGVGLPEIKRAGEEQCLSYIYYLQKLIQNEKLETKCINMKATVLEFHRVLWHKKRLGPLRCRVDCMHEDQFTVVSTGALKTQVLENASTENASTMQTFSQIKRCLVLHKLVWCVFKWGGQVDYRLFFF